MTHERRYRQIVGFLCDFAHNVPVDIDEVRNALFTVTLRDVDLDEGNVVQRLVAFVDENESVVINAIANEPKSELQSGQAGRFAEKLLSAEVRRMAPRFAGAYERHFGSKAGVVGELARAQHNAASSPTATTPHPLVTRFVNAVVDGTGKTTGVAIAVGVANAAPTVGPAVRDALMNESTSDPPVPFD